jgi:hypothetical protein
MAENTRWYFQSKYQVVFFRILGRSICYSNAEGIYSLFFVIIISCVHHSKYQVGLSKIHRWYFEGRVYTRKDDYDFFKGQKDCERQFLLK